jgi:hypothetical protein
VIAYQVGDFVRHKTKSEWGYGCVTSVAADLVHVRFEHEADEKRFQIARAPALLVPVPASAVPAQSQAATSGRRSTAGGTGTTVTKCAACGTKLNRSRYSRDGRWKACPKCSVAHGMQHVLRRIPDAFGTTAERETTDNPDGIQSYCAACRQGEEPPLAGDDVRICGDIPTQAKQP